MKRNAWFTLIIFLLFTAGAAWFYLNKIKQVGVLSSDNTTPSLRSSIDHAIVFEWNESEPMNGNTFQEMKSNLIQELSGGSQLEIVGYYDLYELNTTAYADLGMARANAIAALFPEIDPIQIVYRSEETSLDSLADYFEASRLNVIIGHIHQDTDTLNTQDHDTM